jgi:hypothetical protein
MITAEMATYAYDQIDQAPSKTERRLAIDESRESRMSVSVSA